MVGAPTLMTSEPARNVELKAREHDRRRSLCACSSLGAEDRGVLVQRDTYFDVPTGRLKLREEDGAAAQLISYERADRAEERESRYRIAVIDSPAEVKAVLADAVGVKIEVAKRRRLFLLENVRIHLDDVEDLGRFVEFEAIATDDSDLSREQARVQALRRDFEISDADLIGISYCDLALGGLQAAGPHRDEGDGCSMRPR